MALWLDIHGPRCLDDQLASFILDDLNTSLIRNIAKHKDFPHLIVSGPSGSGKNFLIKCLLHQLYGSDLQIKREERIFLTQSGRKVSIQIGSSKNHIEIYPWESSFSDRVFLLDIMKDISVTKSVEYLNSTPFKVIILWDADKISVDAQHALRRMMEKYAYNVRIVFVVSEVAKLIAPIRSRTLTIVQSRPNVERLKRLLEEISKNENISEKITNNVLHEIIEASSCNVNIACNLLQAFSESGVLLKDEFSEFIRSIYKKISMNSFSDIIKTFRNEIQNALSHGIDPFFILKIMGQIHLEAFMDPRVFQVLALYDSRMKHGKAIIHLEACFIATLLLQK